MVAYALHDGEATMISALGALGSGPGRFAGPLALASYKLIYAVVAELADAQDSGSCVR